MAETGFHFNPIDLIRTGIQKTVGESRMPTEEYESTMIVYGGRLVTVPEGRMVWDRRGVKSKSDTWGDYILRTYDEHVVKKPFQLLSSHPKLFLQFLYPGPKRYRGSNQEIVANVQRLGLEEYYGPHPLGIEIKKPELFTKGIPFQDIYREDLVNSERLSGIDRFQALTEVAKYMRHIHDNFGAIGEGVPYRFIFQKQQGNQVSDPVLFIPDIIYNPDKKFGREDQKATDVLEFLISTALEELRRTQDLKDLSMVKKALDVAINAYGDKRVIEFASSFAKRGRPSLEGLASQHNRAHLGFAPGTQDILRQSVIEACQKYIRQTNT